MRIALAALLLMASAALAGDGTVVLRFRDGRLLPGRVVEISEKGVTHASDLGTAFWPWDALTAFSAYEVRAAAAPDEDGQARLRLGRWCLDAGLPGEARREILRARGLGAGEPSELDALLARCDREQAEAAFAEADRRIAAGDWDGALAVLTSFVRQAPLSEWTEKGRERAADVVRRREAEEVRRRLEEERGRRDAADARRAGAIDDHLAEADAARTRGGVLVLAGLREEDGGSFTAFRQSMEKAEREYLDARRACERARRLAGEERPGQYRAALAGRHAADARLLDIHLRMARKLVDYKNWKDAQAALDKALRLDPVNAEALDLQEKVSANWIRRKASDITNASGHSSDGVNDR